MAKRVLLVTYHFPPSAATGSYRLLSMSRYLPRFGWDTVVVAPPTLPWEPMDERLVSRVPASTRTYFSPYPHGLINKVIRRLGGISEAWLPRCLAQVRRAVRETQPQVILTSSPPHCVHLIGMYAQRRMGIPWVADLRDPIVARKSLGTNRHPLKMRTYENWTMKRARVVIANAAGAQRVLVEQFPQYRSKTATVTNGFDPEDFPRQERKSGPSSRIIHTGELYAGRDPGSFLDALVLLGKDQPGGSRLVHVDFYGRDSDGKLEMENGVKQRGLEAVVHSHGHISYSQSQKEMVASDLLLLIDNPGRKTGVNAKLYEYLGAGRPILAIVEPDSDSSAVLEASGVLYRLVPPDGPAESVARAMRELLQAGTSWQGSPPEKVVRFTREHQMGLLARILDAAVQSPTGDVELDDDLSPGTMPIPAPGGTS
ncbi:MAG: glycosyltransferase [Gemmataceae bacterium]